MLRAMPGSKLIVLTEEQVQLIAKALADRSRYEILKRIGECDDALACETVRDCLGISPPTLSHHMKELETAGLISVQRSGKFVYYRLRREVLDAFFNRLKADLKT
jgi:ArsR family transcriptional regulator, arsenate/arsenite/antimonite-responsive transcriptional repressor